MYGDTVPQVGDRNRNGANKAYTEEWNKSVTFQVKSAVGILVFTMVDDDGAVPGGTDTDGVIRRVPNRGLEQAVNISFKIKNQNHRYLGSYDAEEAMKNITLTGDALFLEDGSVRLDKFPQGMVSYTGATGVWKITLTPTMKLNGGNINIAINWGSYGTHSEDIAIGGASVNGTIVEISPKEFTYGVNQTISVTVTHPTTGNDLTGGTVYLYWLRDDGHLGDMVNYTSTPDSSGGNTYSMPFTTTAQSTWQSNATNGWSSTKAPRNLTAFVSVSNVGYGYAKTKMKAVEDLKVTVYPTKVMAGKVLANKGYSNSLWMNVSTIDSIGNDTGRPLNTDLKVRIFNSTGHDVTRIIGGFDLTENDGVAYNHNFSGDWFREPGTYTVHAYNNTHKSWGSYNATLEVLPVHVECDIGDFIWGVDENISATFTLTWDGQPINNSGFTDYLQVDNVSKQNSGSATQFNRSWMNTSFNWGLKGTGADSTSHGITNTSLELSKGIGQLENGIVKVSDLTADLLDENPATGNGYVRPAERTISFNYKPDSSSKYANCTGSIKVKLPDVSLNPNSLPFNEPAIVTASVTGRGAALENVNVSLVIPGLTGERYAFTDSQGKAVFAFTPPATGNIVVKIENRTSALTIPVTSFSCYIEDVTANEGESFTVMVKNGSATGTALNGATVTITGVGTGTTNANGEATFTAPIITSDRTYAISATLEGHAEATATLNVINVPVLSIVSSDEVKGCTTFEVTIADDSGNSIIGATITSSTGDTFTSGVNGIAEVKALDKEGTMTLTASKDGFATSDTKTITVTKCDGVPGFELISLIAALGIAFIIFKRRRQ